MHWEFAASAGGRDAGLNDPGVQTFKGNFYRYLARELIQNSIDARLDNTKPVRVSFSLEELRQKDIPDVAGLRTAIARCLEFWAHRRKEARQIERGLESLSGPAILCLKVSDFNTRGVKGSDDEVDKDWYNLVMCAGSSSKSEGEGGSYGIGKNAPFAASLPRTVLYSTRTSKRDVAFEGVSVLATHRDPKGRKRQPVGFLGNSDGGAIRDAEQIPEHFLRHEMGTDIWILGYPQSTDWQRDLMYSVLESFWPAITFGDLRVDIGDITVTHENLAEKLAIYSNQADFAGFTGHIYYKAYTNPTFQEHTDVRGLGQCSIYVMSDETLSTKRVAMIRRGMVITQRLFRWPMPFAGVFICTNDQGNAKLREMEPPRHDDWDPDHPEPGANRAIFNSIGASVRDVIKQLNPMDDTEAINVPGLERFLPDLGGDTAVGLWNDGDAAESGDGVVRPDFELKEIPMRSRATTGPVASLAEDDADEDGVIESPESDGNNTGEESVADRTPREAAEDGSRDSNTTRTAIPLRSRAFIVDERLGKYFITVHPEASSSNAYISTWAIGDDERTAVGVKMARLVTGLELPIFDGNVGPVEVRRGEPLEIELMLPAGLRYALEVTASEAD